MTLILLKIGVIVLPFYELLVKVFPLALVQTPDTRTAKLFLGLWIALAIGLSALFLGQVNRCKNRWLLLFLIFIPLNIHLSPQYPIELNGVKSPNYWVWKPFVMILCYFLMFMAVQSLKITRESLSKLLNIMVWCGLVMAGYVILQNFGWDQFFAARVGEPFRTVTKPVTVGTLGNSTIVSPYIAMIIPFALYLRKWVVSGVLIYAVFATQSEMAIGAMIVSIALYSCLRWKLRAIFTVFLMGVFAVGILTGIKAKNPEKFAEIKTKVIQTNGRVAIWKESIRISKEENLRGNTPHPYTGTGLGSYSVLYRPLMKSTFGQAHNEYLEVFCTMGIVGFVLFLMAIGFMLKSAFLAYVDYNQAEIAALLCSFICISLVAFGTFIWQLSPHNYYTVLIFGLLSNRRLLKGELT